MRVATLAAALMLAGCSALAGPGRPSVTASAERAEEPTTAVLAVLPSPLDEKGRAALKAALVSLLGDRSFTLATDAFVHTSEVVLERERPAGEAGRLLTGRETAPPIRLRLLMQREVCLIELADDGRRVEVAAVRCSPQS